MRRVISKTPTSILEFPFESMVGAMCALVGPPQLLGFVSPRSLSSLLPPLGVRAFGLALTLAAVSILSGLWLRRYYTSVPRGLRLLA